MQKDKHSTIAITIDVDWASEFAISQTLDFFEQKQIPVTVFSTHNSEVLFERMDCIEIGLHPYFHPESSHGTTIKETIDYVMALPHNIAAFRNHRFLNSNEIQECMKQSGMTCSSNVCTNLEILPPFYNRFNMLEVPIFFEDGGYLFNNYPLLPTQTLLNKFANNGLKTIVIHPMHFIVNTPQWGYMVNIKQQTSRESWNTLTEKELRRYIYSGQGIRNLIESLLESDQVKSSEFITIGQLMQNLMSFKIDL
jgi:hypothetical protein